MMNIEERTFENKVKNTFSKLIAECLGRNVGWRKADGTCRLFQSPFAREYCGCEYLDREKGACKYDRTGKEV